MTVYRITLAIYAAKLVASGNPARWNSKDVKMIYTAQSKALACLENVVHRNSNGLQQNFKALLIEIPDSISMEEIKEINLMTGWQHFENMPYTQSLGNQWIREAKSVILKVPSAIIKGEFNYLLNPAHGEYRAIRLLKSEPFEFDSRIKGNRRENKKE
jgi:RES domain-containing protein